MNPSHSPLWTAVIFIGNELPKRERVVYILTVSGNQINIFQRESTKIKKNPNKFPLLSWLMLV
jgi:hypothetical protein